MHKDAISLSGLAEKIMFNMAHNESRHENVSYEEISRFDEGKNKTVTKLMFMKIDYI